MNKSLSLTAIAAAAIATLALNVSAVHAADKAPVATTNKVTAPIDKTTVPMDKRMDYSDRARVKDWTSDKEMLASHLKAGTSKADYMKAIADAGFTITSINSDKPDYLEYEVVKGTDSYEVQIDLDKKTKMGTKVEVDRNLWRADATKQAIRSGKAVAATKALPEGHKFSDRAYSKNWTSEKDKLEKSLGNGKDVATYKAELKKMGYQVTSVNDKDKDYVEMEVVKGNDSYEVQIDLDDAGKGKKVDVAANMWQSEATDKALDSHKK